MECKVQLLRRPLPPKSPNRLPVRAPYKGKTVTLPEDSSRQVKTACLKKPDRVFKTGPDKPEYCDTSPETLQHHDTGPDKSQYHGTGPDKPRYHVTVQNILLDLPESVEMTSISGTRRSTKTVHWNILEPPVGPTSFPGLRAASTQESRRRKSDKRGAEKQKSPASGLLVKTRKDRKKIPCYVLKPKNFNPYFGTSRASASAAEKYLPKIMAIGISPLIVTALDKEIPWARYKQRRPGFSLNVVNFAETVPLPKVPLPRRPQKQVFLETLLQDKATIHVPKSVYVSKLSRVIQSREYGKFARKLEISASYAVHGEGFKMFKTIAATQYETVLAMVNLAVINCQLFGRNALNLKGFFIINCPDLTSLAHQLIYINLSYNDLSYFPTEVLCVRNLQVLLLRNNPIKEIPSSIQQLKSLQILNMAFNLLTSLPAGLFNLYHLRKLDVAYNSITTLPNDILKLRSLEKLAVDGNELETFPAAILRLNLKKISYTNNFTHHCFWKQPHPTVFKPQSLGLMAALVFMRHKLYLYYGDVSPEVSKYLRWTSTCDWCLGPRLGEGFRTIQTFSIFGRKHLPVTLHVCSPTCLKDISRGMPRSSFLFQDWSKVWNQSDSTLGRAPPLHPSNPSLMSGISRGEP